MKDRRRTRPRRSLALFAALVVGAAAPASAQSPAGIVRDNAGVSIVEHRTLATTVSRVRIDPRPAFSIGGLSDDEDQELDSRQPWLSLTRLRDGGFVVNEMTQLKFFTSDGRFVRNAGRAGRGPGEFRQTREVCPLRGDTLLVVDYSVGTLTLWDHQGNSLQTIARPGIIPLNGCRPDGTIILQGVESADSVSGKAARFAEYSLARPDGTIVRRIGRFPLATFAGPVSFEMSLRPLGDGFLFADPAAGSLRVLAANGQLKRIIRITATRGAPSEAEWRSQVLGMVPRNAFEESRTLLVSRMMPLRPSTTPAFGRVYVDPEGRIWIHDVEVRERYHLMTAEGTLLGHADLPEGRFANFLPGHVVVNHRDADGAPRLRMHRVEIVKP